MTRSRTQEEVLSHSGIFKDFGEVDLRCEVYSEAKTNGKCQKLA